MATVHTTLFPYTNPIQFCRFDANGERLDYEEYHDSWDNEMYNCFTQVFALQDRVSFQFSWRNLAVGSASSISVYSIVNGVQTTIANVSLQGVTQYGDTSLGVKQTEINGLCNGLFWISKSLEDLIPSLNAGDEFKLIIRPSWENYWHSNIMRCIDDTSKTKLIHYSNVCAAEQTVFDTYFGYMPLGYDLRLPACFSEITSESDKEVFMGYEGNVELVSSLPYETVALYIGADGIGIPRYLQRLLNTVFCLEEKYIDGVQYEVTGDGKLEKISTQGYANDQYKIVLQKKMNRFGTEVKGENSYSIMLDDIQQMNSVVVGSLVVTSSTGWYIQGDNDVKFSVVSGGSGTTRIKFEMPVNVSGSAKTYVFNVRNTEDGGVEASISSVFKSQSKKYLNYMVLGDTFILR